MSNRVEIGDAFIVEMLQNKKKRTEPVCKCNGRIGFMNPRTTQRPLVGQTWTVSVINIQGTFIIVDPVFMEMSRYETTNHKNKMLAEFVRTNKNCHYEKS